MPRKKITIEEKKARRSIYDSLRYQTPKEWKRLTIKNWRRSGLKDIYQDNYEYFYNEFINTSHCMICGIQFAEKRTRKMTRRCLDHDHETNLYRCVCCAKCNLFYMA